MKQQPKGYCTAFPEGRWGECCKLHDLAYETQQPKHEADVQLFKCVADSDGFGVGLIAALMFMAVSTAGGLWYRKYRVK